MFETEPIESVAEVPVCLGCGLMSHLMHENNRICPDCFNRKQRRDGGGGLRVVTSGMTSHETPLCPAVRQADGWRYWREEDCLYAGMAGNLDRCRRCYMHSFHGFDHYRGRDTVIAHA